MNSPSVRHYRLTTTDSDGQNEPFGVYVHVPFCAHRCDYCAFATWTDRAHLVDEYLAAVRTEIAVAVDDGMPVATSVFVGGGTPFFQDQNPVPRRYAFSSFSSLNQAFLKLSQNSATGDGGTCFGDSGGPNFVTVGAKLVLVATTVKGDEACRSTNVDYRLDTRAARTFLGQYVSLP